MKKYVLDRYIRPLVKKSALFYMLPQTPNAPGQMYYSKVGVTEVINDEETQTRTQKILFFAVAAVLQRRSWNISI